MQKKLLGVRGIQELEEEAYRKSLAEQEEQQKEQLEQNKKEASSDSSDDGESPVIQKKGVFAFF